MRRMVVCAARGEVITDSDVEEHELLAALSLWIRLLPDAIIYLDGELVPEGVRAALKLVASATAPSPCVALPEPEKLKGYAETMQRAFDDVRKFYVQGLHDLQDCAKRFSDMWIERERQFADEAARQRQLTQRSLADIDLLGRSVKAVQFREALAASGTNTSARAQRRDGIASMDIVSGLLQALNGEN